MVAQSIKVIDAFKDYHAENIVKIIKKNQQCYHNQFYKTYYVYKIKINDKINFCQPLGKHSKIATGHLIIANEKRGKLGFGLEKFSEELSSRTKAEYHKNCQV